MKLSRAEADNPRRGIALRLVAGVCFSVMAALVKLTADSKVPFVEIMFFRSAFALIPVILYIVLLGDFGLLKTARPKVHAIRAAMGGTSMVFIFMGIIYLPLNDATAISFSMPLAATVLSALFLKEHVGPHRWLAIVLGLVGVLVIVHPDPGKLVAHGAIYALVGVLMSAAVTVAIRQIAATEPGVTITFYFMLLLMIPLAMILPFYWVTPTPAQALLMLGVGVIGGIGQLAMTMSLRYASVSTLVPFDYSQILWASLIAWTLWSELPSRDTLLGVAIITASGLYIFYRERKVAAIPQRVASAIEEG